MADQTLTAQTAASALGGTELFYGVQGGNTRKITADQIKTFVSASPTLTTPDIGTPTAGVATNLTGLPVSTGISGLGTGVATALAVNTGTAGAPVLFNGAGGTPTSLTLTNATGLPVSTGISGLGTGVATWLATPSSANLASAITDETGSGSLVFGTSPTFTTKITVTGGTVTASAPAVDVTQTWNSGAVAFTAFELNVTDTTSDGASQLANLKVGGTSKFSVRKDGVVTASQAYYSGSGVNLGAILGSLSGTATVGTVSGGKIGFSSDASFVAAGLDTTFQRVAAGIIGVRNGTTGGAALSFVEQTAPSAPATNGVYIYAEDNGSGKTRLMALFPTGAAQQIAIEP